MDHAEFFFHHPKEWIHPKKYEHHIRQHLIIRMFFFYMRNFMIEDLLALPGMQVNCIVPKDRIEKRKRGAFRIC